MLLTVREFIRAFLAALRRLFDRPRDETNAVPRLTE